MYPVSQAFLDAIQSTDRDVALKIHIDTAFDSFDLDDSDVLQGSFKLDTGCLSGDTLAPGGVKAADLSVTILNKAGRYDDVQFNGATLTAQSAVKTADGDYEWVPLGVFNIDDVSRPTSVVTIGATDNLLLFDQPFKDVSISYPATNLEILSAICAHCGVILKTASFINSSYMVQSAPDGDMSCRDVLSDIAEMAAGFAHCDYNGELEIVQLNSVKCVQEATIDGGTFDLGNLLNPAVGALSGAGSAAANQIVSNGNMSVSSSNTATGFSITSATPVSCDQTNGQTLKATAANGAFQYIYSHFTDGHRYFVAAYVKAASPNVQLSQNDGTNTLTSAHPGDNQFHWLHFVITAASVHTANVLDASTSGWQNFSVRYFVVVDMGTSAAPTAFYSMTDDQMIQMVNKKIILQNSYWEGSGQLGGVDVTVDSDGTITLDTGGGAVMVATNICLLGTLRGSGPVSGDSVQLTLKNGQQYTHSISAISGTMSGVIYINFDSGSNANTNWQITNSSTSKSYASSGQSLTNEQIYIPSGATFSAYTFRLQLEQGSAATAWKPYSKTYTDGDPISGGNFSRWQNKSRNGGAFNAPVPVIDLGPSNRYNFSIDDSPITITGIELQAEDQTYLLGSDDYAVTISDNKLIQGDPTDVLNAMFDVLHGFTYLPFTSDWQGNPALQPGDIVSQTDRNGVKYNTLVTNSVYAYRGKCQLQAKGSSQLNSSYQSQMTKKVSQLLRNIHQKQVQLDSLSQAIINATNLIASALGGYVIQGTGDYEGNLFIADNQDITKAVRVWRWNLGGFGYSSTGVGGPYSTAITADGSIVANVLLARIITGDMIKAGTITADNIKGGTITGDQIAGSTITGDKIQAGTISGDKLSVDTVLANKLTTSASTNIIATIGAIAQALNGYGFAIKNSNTGSEIDLYEFADSILGNTNALNSKGHDYLSIKINGTDTIVLSANEGQLWSSGNRIFNWFYDSSDFGCDVYGDLGVYGNISCTSLLPANGRSGTLAVNGHSYTFTDGILTNVT